MPSRDFTSEDLFSSRMMSMQSSTHSSQMNTVGPAMSLRTSCWLFPQNEQYSVFLESLVPTLLILISVRRSISSARSLHSGTYRLASLDRAKSVPEKTLAPDTARIAANFILVTRPPEPTMLTADYQEFANPPHPAWRDNSVIWGVGTTPAAEIRAALRDCNGTFTAKSELS